MITLACADARNLPLADGSVRLVMGSPPYALKGRRYGDKGTPWPTVDWVRWMVEVTAEACRVVRDGYVVWVVNSGCKDGVYEPAVEGLVWNAWLAGICTDRPVVWHKNAPPNRRDWWGNDHEFCVAFRVGDRAKQPWNWEAIAEPPRYKTGGRFRQRDANGRRRLPEIDAGPPARRDPGDGGRRPPRAQARA